ncbi:MAG TPA: HAD family hydrolase [Pilimelia sp.]|nr:HAD family hydrolase [Pilimelia sp.]
MSTLGTAVRLVATDLDGTLLRRDGTVSPRTAALLKRINAGGVHVALVTGRPVRWVTSVYEQLHAPLPSVCANGAIVYDPVTDTILRADPLAPELVGEVCRRLRAELPEVTFAVEVSNGREMRYEKTYPIFPDADPAVVKMVQALDDLCTAPAIKLIARMNGVDSAGFAARVSACVAGLVEATHSSDSGFVEISAAGVTKAAGLAWLCERLGVSAGGVVAFGDMPNDVPMLSWAGRAVAVANAHPAVREVANDVTVSNEEDGVAAYLEGLFRELPG